MLESLFELEPARVYAREHKDQFIEQLMLYLKEIQCVPLQMNESLIAEMMEPMLAEYDQLRPFKTPKPTYLKKNVSWMLESKDYFIPNSFTIPPFS